MGRNLVGVTLAPATALLDRLCLGPKLVVIALVLIAPALFATWQFRSQQDTQIAFSAKERVGVRELVPASRLLADLARARGLAVRGAGGDRDAGAYDRRPTSSSTRTSTPTTRWTRSSTTSPPRSTPPGASPAARSPWSTPATPARSTASSWRSTRACSAAPWTRRTTACARPTRAPMTRSYAGTSTRRSPGLGRVAQRRAHARGAPRARRRGRGDAGRGRRRCRRHPADPARPGAGPPARRTRRPPALGALAPAFARIVAYLREAADAAGRIARGDLTVQPTPRSERDVFGSAFAAKAGQLRTPVGRLSDSASRLGLASQQMAASATELARTADELETLVGTFRLS